MAQFLTEEDGQRPCRLRLQRCRVGSRDNLIRVVVVVAEEAGEGEAEISLPKDIKDMEEATKDKVEAIKDKEVAIKDKEEGIKVKVEVIKAKVVITIMEEAREAEAVDEFKEQAGVVEVVVEVDTAGVEIKDDKTR